jgi:hypothetical protein
METPSLPLDFCPLESILVKVVLFPSLFIVVGCQRLRGDDLIAV